MWGIPKKVKTWIIDGWSSNIHLAGFNFIGQEKLAKIY